MYDTSDVTRAIEPVSGSWNSGAGNVKLGAPPVALLRPRRHPNGHRLGSLLFHSVSPTHAPSSVMNSVVPRTAVTSGSEVGDREAVGRAAVAGGREHRDAGMQTRNVVEKRARPPPGEHGEPVSGSGRPKPGPRLSRFPSALRIS